MLGQTVQFILDQGTVDNILKIDDVDGYAVGQKVAAVIVAENEDGTQDLLLLLNRLPMTAVMPRRSRGSVPGTWQPLRAAF